MSTRIRSSFDALPSTRKHTKDIKDYLTIPTTVMRNGKIISIAENNALRKCKV